nr:zinc finger protein 333-like [Onthophagus taurus]
MFICEFCQVSFTAKHNLDRHMRGKHGQTNFDCTVCGGKFSRRDNLNVHLKRSHGLSMKRQAPPPPLPSTIEHRSNLEMEVPGTSTKHQSNLEMVVPTPSTSPPPPPPPLGNKRHRYSARLESMIENDGRVCQVCGDLLPSLISLECHLRTEHVEIIDDNVKKFKSCYKNRVVCYRIDGAQPDDDIPSYLLKCCETVNRLIEQHLNRTGSVKA